MSFLESTQESLPFGYDEQSLCKRLHALSGFPVSISITLNSVSVLSVKYAGGKANLRMNRIFLHAGEEVISEVARFIKNRRKGERFPLLSRFIRKNMEHIRKNAPEKVRNQARRSVLKTVGRFHDLSTVFDSINREYFEGSLLCEIGWGRRSRGYAVRKRTLGSYSPPRNGNPGLIRINPVLDRKSVPSYYLRFVVYHEMLHAHLGVAMKNGRHLAHSPEFRRRERLFREYQKAMAWEKIRLP